MKKKHPLPSTGVKMCQKRGLPYQTLAPPGLDRGHDSPPRPPRPSTAVLNIVRGFQKLFHLPRLARFFWKHFAKNLLKILNKTVTAQCIHCSLNVQAWTYLKKSPLYIFMQIWSPDGAICSICKFSHQVALLALFASLVESWHHLHCHIAWDCPSGNIS